MWQVSHGNQVIIESNTCLKPMVEPWALSLVQLYRHYKNSVLPFTGGLYDQPNYYLEAMDLIGNVILDG